MTDEPDDLEDERGEEDTEGQYICEEHLTGRHRIEVKRVIGTLSDIERVLVGLDLRRRSRA
jgi:hypothetical protein